MHGGIVDPRVVDLEDLRRAALQAVCAVTLAVSWCWLALRGGATQYYPPPMSTLLPPGVMLVTSIVCLVFPNANSGWRGASLVSGLAVALLLGHRWTPSAAWAYYGALVVTIGAPLFHPGFPFVVAAVLTGAFTVSFHSAGNPYPSSTLRLK